MILTFTLLGVYLNLKFIEWFNNIWAGNLVLGGTSVVLAGVVIFILLKDA